MKKNTLFLILSLTVIFTGLNISPETFLSHKTLQVPNLGLVQLTKLLGPILSVKSCNHSAKHIKPNSIFHWTVELDKLFNDTKTLIISKVEQGIQTFDTKRRQTCIKHNWSKDGIGCLVLQQLLPMQHGKPHPLVALMDSD